MTQSPNSDLVRVARARRHPSAALRAGAAVGFGCLLGLACAPALVAAPPAPSRASPSATPPIVSDEILSRPDAAAQDESLLDANLVRTLRPGDELAVPISSSASVRLRVAATGTMPDGARTLSLSGGRELGSSPFATASLVVRGEDVGGFVRLRDGFETAIVPMGPGRQRLVAKPVQGFDCDGLAIPPHPPEPLPVGDCVDGPLLQDVLVLYTAEAAAFWGSESALQTLIAAAMVDANIALKNSGAPQRVRLVGTELLPFTQGASIGVDLDRLADPNDGIGDIAHQYRNAYGADLVQLVSTSPGCGIAYLFDGLPSSGFSVVNADCLGGFVPAHELGHNYGCCHAVGDGGGCENGGFYPFSNGWRFIGNSGTLWRTVMAYEPGERIPYFSNPSRTFDGKPIGASGSGPEGANNTRTIILASATISQFRCAVDDAVDCNGNGTPDAIDLLDGTSEDCNGNGVPDECDIAFGSSADANANGIPDECEVGAVKFGPVDTPGDPRILDVFGFSASIGRLLAGPVDPTPFAVLGAYGDDEAALNAGAAFVFGLAGPESGQQAKLLASDPAPNANFGRSVAAFRRAAQATPAASARSFAAIGAFRQPDGANAQEGAVYVFAREAGPWLERLKQKPSDGQAGDWFGFSLAMGRVGADNHETLVVGAPRASGGKGAVYVYRYLLNDTTTLSKKLLAPLSLAGADFGWSVAMDESVTILAGNPPAPVQRAILVAGLPGDGSNAGRVRVYERNVTANQNFPSNGQNIALPPAISTQGDRFGEAVAIRDNFVAVGAPGKDGGRGAVYLYERTAPLTWVARQTLQPPAGQTDGRFGQSVSLALRSDGAYVLLIGAPKSDIATAAGAQPNAGLVYAYARPSAGGDFVALGAIAAFDAQAGDEFGTAIDATQLSAAAPLSIWMLIGSPFDDDGGLNAGSAYLLPIGD